MNEQRKTKHISSQSNYQVCQHNIRGYIHGCVHGYPYPRQAWSVNRVNTVRQTLSGRWHKTSQSRKMTWRRPSEK